MVHLGQFLAQLDSAVNSEFMGHRGSLLSWICVWGGEFGVYPSFKGK